MKYTVKGPVIVTVEAEIGYTVQETVSNIAATEYSDVIEEFMEENDDDLADYIGDDSSLNGVVWHIRVNVKEELYEGRPCLRSVTSVETAVPLTDEQKRELLDYIRGQFSDGYGESLEQRAFFTRKVQYTVTGYDENDDSFYSDEETTHAEYFLHLWNSSCFKLEITEA